MTPVTTISINNAVEQTNINNDAHISQLAFINIEKEYENPSWQLAVKRGFDLILATIGLVLLAPLFLIIAIVISIKSPGPIFYKSLRIGKDRKPFYMYKFRTMIVDAEKMRQALAEQHIPNGELFKLKHDPRITPLGAFLRKYSLDEIPQLINVIRGEMSLVGPRPYIPEESAIFEPPYTLRFSVTPGVTGPWQASGRSDLNFQQLCELEFKYIKSWNIYTDISLILKTIPSVLFSKGAY